MASGSVEEQPGGTWQFSLLCAHGTHPKYLPNAACLKKHGWNQEVSGKGSGLEQNCPNMYLVSPGRVRLPLQVWCDDTLGLVCVFLGQGHAAFLAIALLV
ncbi:MAG: hypothetical protein ACJ8BW_12075 [Ktedonobacteraceae bacterium]